MKRILVIVLFNFMISSAWAQDNSDAIVGKWINPDKDSHIEIYKEGGKYYGKVAWLSKPTNAQGKPLVDNNNPNQLLRTRPILGLVIISDLVYKKGQWVDGQIYSPKKGQYASCKIKIKKNGDLQMTVSKSLLSFNQTLKRYK